MVSWNAYLILALSAVLILYWLFLLSWPAWNTLIKWSRLHAIAGAGREIYGHIVRSSYLKTPIPGKAAPIEIHVEFSNFAGSAVEQQFRFMDTKPQERRYETGKSVALKCLERPEPAVILAESKPALRPLFWLAWLTVLGSIGAGLYFLIKPFLEKLDGWQSLLHALEQVEVAGMLVALGIGAAITLFVIGSFFKSFSEDRGSRLKFFGVKTMAKIQSRRETGVYVNRQPQIEYQYVFQDRNGVEHIGLDRELISLLDMATVAQTTEREIMYLPESPSISSFITSVSGPSAHRIILKLVLHFVFFIFSVVLGGTVISQLLSWSP